jgi:hypothetical protein
MEDEAEIEETSWSHAGLRPATAQSAVRPARVRLHVASVFSVTPFLLF